MTERDQITELEHRIGQATMMAESMALEGGVARACALRFLAALEVPVAEWPVAPEAAVADAEAPGDPDPSADPSRALARSHEGARQRAGTPEPVPGTDGMAYAALDRATERMRAAEARVAELENAITWNTSCTSCARVLDSAYEQTCRAEAAEGKLASLRTVLLEGGQGAATARRRALAVIGSEEESRDA